MFNRSCLISKFSYEEENITNWGMRGELCNFFIAHRGDLRGQITKKGVTIIMKIRPVFLETGKGLREKEQMLSQSYMQHERRSAHSSPHLLVMFSAASDRCSRGMFGAMCKKPGLGAWGGIVQECFDLCWSYNIFSTMLRQDEKDMNVTSNHNSWAAHLISA